MARDGDRAILVIGGLLKAKTSVRMWGEGDDYDATRAHERTEIGRLRTYNQGYRGSEPGISLSGWMDTRRGCLGPNRI
jgi:hypothetical protein